MHSEYKGVTDGSGQRVVGLWERNGVCYMQLRVKQADGRMAPRRIPLESMNVDDCIAEMARKRRIRDQGDAATEPLVTPSFAQCCEEYLTLHESAKHGVKRKSTLLRQRYSLAKWRTHFGRLRVTEITRPMINAFMQKRLRGGRNPRTVNLDLINVRLALKFARDCGYFGDRERLPTEGIKPLRWHAPVRPLLKDEQFAALCKAADASDNRSGPILADFIRFVAYSGGRYQESLRLKWKDVSFELGQVTFGSDGLAKNGKARVVDFNQALEAHLRAMHARRAPDCKYLFPSPQRGGRDIHAHDLRGSLFTARKAVDLEWVGFHDFRHFFASYCVMSGIDFKTIAEWLGHESGTILIDKVYGHLAADHKRRMAQKAYFSLAQQAAAPVSPTARMQFPAPTVATPATAPKTVSPAISDLDSSNGVAHPANDAPSERALYSVY